MLWVKFREPSILDLSWLALVDEEWGQCRQVLADACQEGNPRSITVLRCPEQFALLFDTKGKYSLRSIDHPQEKALFIDVVRVAG